MMICKNYVKLNSLIPDEHLLSLTETKNDVRFSNHALVYFYYEHRCLSHLGSFSLRFVRIRLWRWVGIFTGIGEGSDSGWAGYGDIVLAGMDSNPAGQVVDTHLFQDTMVQHLRYHHLVRFLQPALNCLSAAVKLLDVCVLSGNATCSKYPRLRAKDNPATSRSNPVLLSILKIIWTGSPRTSDKVGITVVSDLNSTVLELVSGRFRPHLRKNAESNTNFDESFELFDFKISPTFGFSQYSWSTEIEGIVFGKIRVTGIGLFICSGYSGEFDRWNQSLGGKFCFK